jgi:hypothetical protein
MMGVARLFAILGAIGLAATLVAVAAAPAPAASYTVYSCHTPDGQSAGVRGWSHAMVGGNNAGANYCSRPQGSFALFMRGGKPHAVGELNELVFTAPEDTSISAYTLWRSALVWQTSAFDYSYELLEDSRAAIREACEGNSNCMRVGDPAHPLAAVNRVTATGPRNLHSLYVSLGCRGTLTCGALTNGDSPAKLWFHRSDIQLTDDLDPAITAVSGPLVSGALLAGAQLVSISAQDGGSGVYQVRVVIDGRTVSSTTLDDNGGDCKPPFTNPVPCKLRASGTLLVDTSGLTDGRHTVLLVVTDATGANTGGWGPVRVTTANAGCTPRPLVRTLHVSASIRVGKGRRSRRARSVRVRYGGRPTVTGQLRNLSGAPLPRALLCVATRDEREGARTRRVQWIRTDAEGRFRYRLARGPSRRVYFVRRTGTGANVASLVVHVRAPVRLATSRRRLRTGQRVVFRGRLGKPFPRTSVLVELQARRETGWQTFATTRSRHGGAFAVGYQFTRTTGVHTYKFRALVRQQSGYPFATGASRAVGVRVSG